MSRTGATRPLPRPTLLVITDRRQARRPLAEIAEAVFAAGGRWLLLREKDLAADARRALLRDLQVVAARHGALVSVSADLDAARAAGGLHLPRDGDLAAARAALGPEVLIGRSAHCPEEALAAAEGGADYITLSPIFDSRSKPGYGPALGLAGLRGVARLLAIPVIALGGVDRENACSCLDAGAAGVAAMGAIMRAADPGAAVAAILTKLQAKHGSGQD